MEKLMAHRRRPRRDPYRVTSITVNAATDEAIDYIAAKLTKNAGVPPGIVRGYVLCQCVNAVKDCPEIVDSIVRHARLQRATLKTVQRRAQAGGKTNG